MLIPHADAERPDPRDVLARIPLGARVVVRSLIEGGARASDSVGELLQRDGGSVLVGTRAGPVRVELSQVVAAKAIPPGPAGAWRVPPFLRRAGVAVVGSNALLRPDGTRSPAVLELVAELLEAGTPTVITHGADTGWGTWEGPGPGPLSIALPDAGGAPGAPAPEAVAEAHDAIKAHLVRPVGRARVHYTDARPPAVDAARVFGWQGRVFTLPPGASGR